MAFAAAIKVLEYVLTLFNGKAVVHPLVYHITKMLRPDWYKMNLQQLHKVL